MSCNSNFVLNKQLKVFRTPDTALHLYWIDAPINDVDPSSSSTVSITKIAEYFGKFSISETYTVEKLFEGSDTLFYTKTSNKSLNLPIDEKGTLNPNVFWAGYISDGKYLPIEGVKYFDMYYDPVTDSIDLVFWANILVTDLPTTARTLAKIDQFGAQTTAPEEDDTTTNSPDVGDLYPDSLVDRNQVNDNAQRVVFYSHGLNKKVELTLSNGGKYVTNMFIFTKPIAILCPGHPEGANASQIFNEIPMLSFLELQ